MAWTIIGNKVFGYPIKEGSDNFKPASIDEGSVDEFLIYYNEIYPELVWKFSVSIKSRSTADIYELISGLKFESPWSAWYQIIDDDHDRIHFSMENENDAVQLRLMIS